MSRNRANAVLVAVIMVLLGACGGPSIRSASDSGGQAAAPAVHAQKLLRIGVQQEHTGWSDFEGGNRAQVGGSPTPLLIAQDVLVDQMEIDSWQPRLAVAKPSVQDGTWTLNPDGSMETVFKLKSNALWHDGAPFTSADMLFTFRAFMDPELPTSAGAPRRSLISASAPDPFTFVVLWKDTFVNADRGQFGNIMPKHLLEELYETDKLGGFVRSKLFTTEFIGLGPYKLVRWEQGAFIEFERFESYHMGRPPLDRIIVKIVTDANTLVSSILSGEVDVVVPITLDLESAMEVQRRWAGTGNQVRTDLTGGLDHLELAFRPEVARPANGLTNRSVREAFYRAIDRQSLVSVMTQDLSPVADSWYPPGHSLRRDLEPSIPQFPYDVARAQQLLAEEGWVRGADGILTSSQTGERFELPFWGLAGQGFAMERQLNIIADGWKAIGARVDFTIVPTARATDNEYVSSHPGPIFTNPLYDAFYTERLHSRSIPSSANHWTGRNRGGYSNPRVDSILDDLNRTIDPRAQLDLHRELLGEQMGDIALMPLYWEVVPTLMLKGVSGPRFVGNRATHHIFSWDME